MKIKKDVPLFPCTTWKIGGPAEFLIEVDSSNKLIEAIEYGKKKNLPVTILGGGSNVLVSDQGVRGLVIINNSKKWFIFF